MLRKPDKNKHPHKSNLSVTTEQCPLEGNCLHGNINYQATQKPVNKEKVCIGVTEAPWKERDYVRKKSLQLTNTEKEQCFLSRYGKLKKRKTNHTKDIVVNKKNTISLQQ